MIFHKEIRIVFCGGGTGGHVFPALALADGLKSLVGSDYLLKILFIGTADRIESRLVPAAGYSFQSIDPIGFLRGVSMRAVMNNFRFPFRLLQSIRDSKKILRAFQPHVVVGTGGFVSGPPIRAAYRLGIPILLQEQNSMPGMTTKIASKYAMEIHAGFPLNLNGKVRVSGNPLRQSLKKINPADVREKMGLDPQKTTMTILGGSQGAANLNQKLEQSLPELLQNYDFQIIWQTGEHFKPSFSHINLLCKSFFDDMSAIYSATDFAVARAGAITMSELFYFGIPTIFVPFPYATDNHQMKNAKSAVEAGAAMIVQENEWLRFSENIKLLLSDKNMRETMASAAVQLAKPDATKTICKAILNLAEKSHVR